MPMSLRVLDVADILPSIVGICRGAIPTARETNWERSPFVGNVGDGQNAVVTRAKCRCINSWSVVEKSQDLGLGRRLMSPTSRITAGDSRVAMILHFFQLVC